MPDRTGSTITLQIVELGVHGVADLLRELAPDTCALVWERLPVEGRLIHGMYSGPELFIELDTFQPVRAENQVHRAIPGDICYWHDAGDRFATIPAPAGELLFIYGRGAAIMGADGQPTWANLFARLRTDSCGDLLAAGRRTRREGPWTLRVDRGDDPG